MSGSFASVNRIHWLLTCAHGWVTRGAVGNGDTLVVETTNIYPLQTFRGIPPSEHLKVIERFTRADEETILYEFTVDDPTTYTEPWGGEIPFRAFDDLLYEYSCHEGNYALTNILSGAQYQERQREGNQFEQR